MKETTVVNPTKLRKLKVFKMVAIIEDNIKKKRLNYTQANSKYYTGLKWSIL